MKTITRTCALFVGLGGFALLALMERAEAQIASESSTVPQPVVSSNVPTPAAPPSPSAPQTAPGNPPTPATAPTSFWTQNYLTGNWGGFRDQLKNDGISFTPDYTGDFFGDPSGRRHEFVADGLFDLVLDVDLEALTKGAVKDTTFHANAFYAYGPSLTDQYVGGLSESSSIFAYNSLRLDELWVQKLFWDKKISVRVGNLVTDTEFFQSNSASLFVNGTFGTLPVLANNVLNLPSYPVAAPGVRVQLLPTAQTYVMAGIFGKDDVGNQATNNQNGTRFALDSGSGMLIMSEAGFLLNQGPNDKGLQGTYRIGSFVDTGPHTSFASQARFAEGTGPLKSVGTNYGVYGILDQQIYSENSQIISFFVRSGGAPSNTNLVDYYAEGGFNFTGFVPGRANDVGGLAVARAHVSGDYGDAQILQGKLPATAETEIEATYKIQLAPWWSVQPDFQYILSPGGFEGAHDATVLGVRTTVEF